ncbi:peptidase inhibitor family I36 protein [Amycolatopsis sp. H20-H5]|uniref:peptidase inhibitor family I36 protein n=1 Tax=Amycolatopsis sp. H20-H5 TaxID=3046309 RepID=UPI002DB55F4C|nr:peptidase inhibitor family I36 protein [Amycolatopsis sp. H20-H5]MEC3981039.1 peptidase inhibitor family I36 protein [Amycolatopsis sp. H20-H5]
MRISTRTTIAAALTSAIAATTLFAATTASATETGFDRCPANHMCAFDLPEGNGAMVSFVSGSPDLRTLGFNDRATSGANYTGDPFCWYEGYNYTGQSYRSGPGSTGYFVYNDFFSSVRRGPC